MTTAFPGFTGPSASTEAPLEMLVACHLRIQRHCHTLERLALHVREHGSDKDARSAASSILRYFDTAAKDHHADEEEDLFPAMLDAMAGSDPICIRELTQGLAAEHRQLESGWFTLRQSLLQIVAGQAVDLPDETVQRFTQSYARHIRLEEDEVFPMAARLLDENAIERIGRSMRKRRGIGDHLL